MEAKKTKDLRVRLKRVSPSTGKLAKELKSTCIGTTAAYSSMSESSSSDSESGNDLTTVHFKLAAALEAAASAHASGLSFNWQAMKSALISGARSAIKAKDDIVAGKKQPTIVVDGTIKKTPVGQAEKYDKVLPATDAGKETASTSINNLEGLFRQNLGSISIFSSSSSENDDGAGDAEEDGDEYDNDDDEMFFIDSAGTGSDLALVGKSAFTSSVATDICIVDAADPLAVLTTVFDRVAYKPFDDQLLHSPPLLSKRNVSLSQLSLREDNIIEVEIKKSTIVEHSQGKMNRALNPLMDVSNVHVKHVGDEFFTFCSCRKCLEYRELVIPIMVDQFKAAHMVVMLLDVLIKAYGPMLKNETAYNKFEKLLDTNRQVYWLTSGLLYDKRLEHIDFIYDESLSENMIVVLASSILMVNNPMLLLQVLSFHIECIVKAYTEGFLEIVEPDENKIPADEMLTYILDGYDDLCRISDQMSMFLFAFEKDFLQRFSLSWSLLCQRLYYQHVFMNLNDTMLACIITLKEDELTARHASLIKKYIQFDERMSRVDRCWTRAWIELNKFNLSAGERKRRQAQLAVYQLFDTVVQDAQAFALPENGFGSRDGDVGTDQGEDDHDFYDFEFLANRRLAWQNIMTYTKMKWPKGFFEPPNTLVCADECRSCHVILEYHEDNCRCITCSIAIGPWPPRRNVDSTCVKCLAHSTLAEKDNNLYESKLLNACASDDFASFVDNVNKQSGRNATAAAAAAFLELSEGTTSVLNSLSLRREGPAPTSLREKEAMADGAYHIAWTVFQHLSDRPRYCHTDVHERHFCPVDCPQIACRLARKILRRQVSPRLAAQLIKCYQPLAMSFEELRVLLPNILLYSRRMRVSVGNDAAASSDAADETAIPLRPLTEANDFVVKVYWMFVLSVYATYFLNVDEVTAMSASALPLMQLTVRNGDIQLQLELSASGAGETQQANEDSEFLQFLNRLMSLSPGISKIEQEFDFGAYEFQAKLEQFLNAYQRLPCKNDKELSEPHSIANAVDGVSAGGTTAGLPAAVVMPPATCHSGNMPTDATAKESAPKRQNVGKEKARKCCLDHHGELGDHCKENHTGKKRPKKDCNHVRMNETRDRLRKKLSQMVNARKNTQAPPDCNSQHTPEQQPPTPQPPPVLKQPASLLKSAAAAAAAAAATASSDLRLEDEDDSLECLSSLCKRFSHLQTGKKPNGESENAVTKNVAAVTTTTAKGGSTAVKRNAKPNPLLTAAATQKGAQTQQSGAINPSSSAACAGASRAGAGGGLDVVSEIYEFFDSYSQDQSKVKKWINDTLSFIEGSSSSGPGSAGHTGGGQGGATGLSSAVGKKAQPQPTNPKKAAKKAKQRQRKDEEKRIAELQDLRWQFHDIYFKEYGDKWQLRQLKVSKKRDKRRIGELEANIKKLQRAKAKVEAAILELIATVKQTNDEFKFTYLPTKEQQQAKLQELEMVVGSADGVDAHAQQHAASTISASFALDRNVDVMTLPPHARLMMASPHQQQAAMLMGSQTSTCGLPIFNNAAPATVMPFAYPATKPSAATAAAAMCYAPPQQQQLPQDVMAAMAANVTTDPSKRIVTIRRINLPNVPEPQVTVTAKGSSPDKDKLLYTFVNGQLVQTDGASDATFAAAPAAATPSFVVQAYKQPPAVARSVVTRNAGVGGGKELPAAAVFRPPNPPLTKTQRKKERRRLLAQLTADQAQAEAEARAAAEAEEEAKKVATAVAAAAAAATAMQNANRKPDKKSKAGKGQQQAAISVPSKPGKGRKGGMNGVSQSLSTTTSETDDHHSATPQSSVVPTRDNSICSTKPPPSAGKKLAKAAAARKATAESVEKPPGYAQQNQPATVIRAKHLPPEKSKPASKATPSAPIAVVAAPPPLNTAVARAPDPPVRRPKRTSNKLLDQGQFDNNPFKALHMHDSDSDGDSSDSSSVASNGSAGCAPTVAIPPPTPAAGSVSNNNNSNNKQRASIVANAAAATTIVLKSLATPPSQRSAAPKASATPVAAKKAFREASGNMTAKQPPPPQQPKNADKLKMAPAATSSMLAAPPLKGDGKNTIRGTANIAVQRRESSRQQQPLQKPQKAKLAAGGPEQMIAATRDHRSGAGKRGEAGQPALAKRNAGNAPPPTVDGRGVTTSKTLKPPTTTAAEVNTGLTSSPAPIASGGKTLSKRAQKQAQRRQRQQQQRESECFTSGIPQHMGYFNAQEMSASLQPQQSTAYSIAQQMQRLSLSSAAPGSRKSVDLPQAAAPGHTPSVAAAAANVSIMDQLNRGVLVENLSLPPGITLTKVDPVKSEQLRQKSESIRRLSKPLQAPAGQSAPAASTQPATFPHQHHALATASGGATIIAPPVGSMASYYGVPYAGVAAGALNPNGGIIMVESKPAAAPPSVAAAAAAASVGGITGKTTKSKKRRNKAKANNNTALPAGSTGGCAKGSSSRSGRGQAAKAGGIPMPAGGTEMITLRNPMFHAGPASAAATILQQPGLQPPSHGGRGSLPPSGIPSATALPMDQPAAIIKNENGMFTIRNPALHQAVTNGLALGGYRQFGNVSYYTPQEAVAEAARAAACNDNKAAQVAGGIGMPGFSYFSSATPSPGAACVFGDGVVGEAVLDGRSGDENTNTACHLQNNISISCTGVETAATTAQPTTLSVVGAGEPGRASTAPGATVTTSQKCISAIGSEKKQKSRDAAQYPPAQWSNNGGNNVFNESFLGGGGGGGGVGAIVAGTCLQEKYQQSNYYNGGGGGPYDVFTATHSCGDESPPPIITGFNAYLEGIPNTGVIRYDDATFLKNLIPGQQLNNEVTIHNVSEANFGRNAHPSSASPVAHHVEITPVYASTSLAIGSRPTSANIYEQQQQLELSPQQHQQQQQELDQQRANFMANSMVNFQSDKLSDYANDGNLFGGSNLLTLSSNAGSGHGSNGGLDITAADGLVHQSAANAFNYEFGAVGVAMPPPPGVVSAPTSEATAAIIDLNNLLLLKSQTSQKDADMGGHGNNNNNGHSHSQRPSTGFLDDNALETFVQNALQFGASAAASNDEQCSQQLLLNGAVGVGGGGSSCGNSTNSTGSSSVGGSGGAASSQSGSSSSGGGVWW